jgi:cystathionine beta-lyase/cystathionine gamma-synthase
MNKKMKFNTKTVHKGQKPEELYGSVSLPIYQTSTFKQNKIGEYTYDYSRAGNPTRTNLEENICSLEEGKDAISFASGLAAISSVVQLFKSDDHIILTENVYGGTYRLLNTIMNKFKVESSWVDTSSIKSIKSKIKSNTKLIFIETPTNPMMSLSDIKAIVALAKEHNILVAVDNTFMSPYFQRPLQMGADIVIHSTTKYLNGHSDVIGGAVIVNNREIGERLHYIQMSVGAVPGPFDCWLTQRSIKTLHLRMPRHDENGRTIAKYLSESNKINKVFYPGLENHPQHELAKKQQLDPNGKPGFGAMISIDLGSFDKASKFLSHLNIFTLAESLGGVESLICHPAEMTHASISAEDRQRLGISDGLLRLSIGVEDVDDLIADLDTALQNI